MGDFLLVIMTHRILLFINFRCYLLISYTLLVIEIIYQRFHICPLLHDYDLTDLFHEQTASIAIASYITALLNPTPSEVAETNLNKNWGYFQMDTVESSLP